jgi:putative mRNA 3-end processing factor
MLLRVTERGLWCEPADCYLDPWAPVDRALVTHAHGDHLRWGCGAYLVAEPGLGVTRQRLGAIADRAEGLPYGETRTINGVRFSLHPAGHILGSAQIRVEHRGEVWVVSGDYKLDPDPTCAPWEPVRCHTFVTECTFGLPIYRWPAPDVVAAEINAWWRENAAAGRTSFLYGYALGKAQRLLAALDATIGPILTHGAVEAMTARYREAGIALPSTTYATSNRRDASWSRALVLAPPSVDGSTWARRFGPSAAAFASGWMLVRGARRRRGVDRGVVVSDHVDWPQLLEAIEATGATRVLPTHGFTGPVVRWLQEHGYDAEALPTRFTGEGDDVATDVSTDEPRDTTDEAATDATRDATDDAPHDTVDGPREAPSA